MKNLCVFNFYDNIFITKNTFIYPSFRKNLFAGIESSKEYHMQGVDEKQQGIFSSLLTFFVSKEPIPLLYTSVVTMPERTSDYINSLSSMSLPFKCSIGTYQLVLCLQEILCNVELYIVSTVRCTTLQIKPSFLCFPL